MLSTLLHIVLIFTLNPLFSQDSPDEYFKNANRLYSEGKYEESIKEYGKIIERGYENGEIYYNLGNSYYNLKS